MNKKFILIIFIFIISFTLSTNADSQHRFKTVTVNKGDTLWKIAIQHTANYNDKDIREVINDIIIRNNLSYNEVIVPGQILKIPVE